MTGEIANYEPLPLTRPARGAGMLVVLAVALAFVDESIRKILPNQPVMVTAAKDLLLALAGLIVLVRSRYPIRPYVAVLVPWIAMTIFSAMYVTLRYGAPLAPFAVGRTYTIAPLLLLAGYHLAYDPVAAQRVRRLFVVGVTISMLVTVAQEYARGSLPEFLSARVTKEGHSLAGGGYNEGLFASPQTQSAVVMCLLFWLIATAIFTRSATRALVVGAMAMFGGFVLLLVRIRVALPLVAVSAAVTTLLAGRSGTRLNRILPRIAAGVLIVGILGVLAALTIQERDTFDIQQERDVNFFLYLLDVREWMVRLTLVFREVENLYYHNPLFGYGAGTGGIVRSVIYTPEMATIPIVKDTGLYLLYHEMGLLGVAAFAVGYIGLLGRAFVRIIRQRTVPPAALPAVGSAMALTIWFLLKSHTIISNGLTHAMWLGSLGLCLGILNRAREHERLGAQFDQQTAASAPAAAPAETTPIGTDPPA